jgi:hypothetical protein
MSGSGYAGGRRSAQERHQTLQATVDWSYSLLDERERAVFDRLGVFTGSFDAAATQAIVVEGVEAWDVGALAELVAKSMVVAEETGEGTTRYQLLERCASMRGNASTSTAMPMPGVVATPRTSRAGRRKPGSASSAVTSSVGGNGRARSSTMSGPR